MEIWDTIEFGARALMLKSAASKPLKEIQRTARSRLEQLVAHARNKSSFWREKFRGISESSFE
ncbi:MAG TPA: hypothetical protein VFW73_13425, partial [Lacipirellulaceae bacterium]|nr:hypothetical protein [Lacipirellulaceae bacterium]